MPQFSVGETILNGEYRIEKLLRYVYQGETFVNAEMQRLWYAVVLTVRPNVKYLQKFEEIETLARQARRGVWK